MDRSVDSLDRVYGISLTEWLYRHKIADIQCDIDILRDNLYKVVRKDNSSDIELIKAIKNKIEEKEKLLKRVKQWYMKLGKN